jgi:hypothetical protein
MQRLVEIADDSSLLPISESGSNLDAAREGHGSLVLFTGEPGIGKTRPGRRGRTPRFGLHCHLGAVRHTADGRLLYPLGQTRIFA